MRYCVFAVCVFAVCFFIGCGPSNPAPKASVPYLHEVQLTMEIWEASQEEEKFSPEVIKRLRKEDKRLKTPSAWKEFQETKLKPSFEAAVGIPYKVSR